MTTTTISEHYCEGCGTTTNRLFDGDSCGLCHLDYLSGSGEGRSAILRRLSQSIHDAIRHEGVHPEDIRQTVELALAYAIEHGWAEQLQRVDEISAELRAHKALLRDEVADTRGEESD